jgi:hypothetical protein
VDVQVNAHTLAYLALALAVMHLKQWLTIMTPLTLVNTKASQ